MIKLKNITKIYNEQTILKDINLEIVPGRFTTLLGKNGAGKSTLLKLMAGNELPDQGNISYQGQELTSMKFAFQHDINFVHENINLMLPQVIGEFINTFREEIPNWNQSFFEEMVAKRKIALDRHFQFYSRGQKMQILLMMALASNPKVLLLDEITSVIDVYGRKYFLDLLKNHAEAGNTVVMTTNTINELEFYTQELIIINDSKIKLAQSIDNVPIVFTKLRTHSTLAHPIFQDAKCIWAGVNSDKSITYIIPTELISQYNLDDSYIDRRKVTLEDIFIYYFSAIKEEYADAA